MQTPDYEQSNSGLYLPKGSFNEGEQMKLTRSQSRANARLGEEVQKKLNALVKECMEFLRDNAGNKESQENKITELNGVWYKYIRSHDTLSKGSKDTLYPAFGADVARLLRQISNPPPQLVK